MGMKDDPAITWRRTFPECEPGTDGVAASIGAGKGRSRRSPRSRTPLHERLVLPRFPPVEQNSLGTWWRDGKNKLQTAIASVTPAGLLAEQHRRQAKPGTAS